MNIFGFLQLTVVLKKDEWLDISIENDLYSIDFNTAGSLLTTSSWHSRALCTLCDCFWPKNPLFTLPWSIPVLTASWSSSMKQQSERHVFVRPFPLDYSLCHCLKKFQSGGWLTELSVWSSPMNTRCSLFLWKMEDLFFHPSCIFASVAKAFFRLPTIPKLCKPLVPLSTFSGTTLNCVKNWICRAMKKFRPLTVFYDSY